MRPGRTRWSPWNRRRPTAAPAFEDFDTDTDDHVVSHLIRAHAPAAISARREQEITQVLLCASPTSTETVASRLVADVRALWDVHSTTLLRRETDMAAIAAAAHWTFTPTDFRMQTRDRALARNVCRTTMNGHTLTVYDRFRIEPARSRDQLCGLTVRTNVCLGVPHAPSFAIATITNPTGWTRLGPRVSTADERIDARYAVHCVDRDWIRHLLDDRVCAALDAPEPIEVVLDEGVLRLTTTTGGADADVVAHMVALAHQFNTHLNAHAHAVDPGSADSLPARTVAA
jgi:hypothetical protein